MIIFGSIRFLSKKVTKPNFFFFKKNRKRTENRVKPTGFGLVRFFREKTGSNWFGSVFPVLARFFSGFGSVRFSFFDFLLIKPNRTEPAGFFKIMIGLIGVFFGYFFLVFSV